MRDGSSPIVPPASTWAKQKILNFSFYALSMPIKCGFNCPSLRHGRDKPTLKIFADDTTTVLLYTRKAATFFPRSAVGFLRGDRNRER